MASEDIGLLPTQRLNPGLNAQLLFQDDRAFRLNCSATHRRVDDPAPKTRELSGFMDDKLFSVDRDRFIAAQGPAAEFRRNMYGGTTDRQDPQDTRNWNGYGPTSTSSGGDESDGEERRDEKEEEADDNDDGDEVDGGYGEGEELVGIESGSKKNSSGDSGDIVDKIGNGHSKAHAQFGGPSARGMMMKDRSMVQPGGEVFRASTTENNQQRRVGNFQNMVTIAAADGEMYYSQFIQGSEGSGQGQKDVTEDGCAFSGRKEGSFSCHPRESLRAIFSDPVTGTLMDDAMILPCGHSFGAGGIQQVMRMKACYTCSQSVSEDSVAPNLSLRTAVQAFHREEDLQMDRASKRRRERFEQANYGDSSFMDTPRCKSIQFPFVVTDRVIIKGNKRTPERFVGREAIVTTQCLNGWYVVKTLDNAEICRIATLWLLELAIGWIQWQHAIS
ncbi:hypothetical protein Nepgr_028878 [Nepenthes gracilis]|uniref:U-box domain-containing protein n=1 Tax=Nepenthes gracilis TaxID=150966 RepID=A0AAD3TB72_NEPGR|nr:hypothetical protein Nepgr_028878 [Nepenthes gracilis]